MCECIEIVELILFFFSFFIQNVYGEEDKALEIPLVKDLFSRFLL